jgi:hypothetical protein
LEVSSAAAKKRAQEIPSFPSLAILGVGRAVHVEFYGRAKLCVTYGRVSLFHNVETPHPNLRAIRRLRFTAHGDARVKHFAGVSCFLRSSGGGATTQKSSLFLGPGRPSIFAPLRKVTPTEDDWSFCFASPEKNTEAASHQSHESCNQLDSPFEEETRFSNLDGNDDEKVSGLPPH